MEKAIREIGLFVIALTIGVVGTELLHALSPQTTHGGANPADARFVAIGRAYYAELGKAYASAIVAGAAELDAGKPVSVTIEAIGHNWDQNRHALFDQVVAPGLNQVLPEGTADEKVTASQRAALVAALRGLAKGLDP